MESRVRSVWPDVSRPLVVTLHAPPLPGAPNYGGNWRDVERRVLMDAQAYLEQDVDGILLENFGDAPFYPHSVPPITLTCVTTLATKIRGLTSKPLGINLLRNDGVGALAVAMAADAQFIRVNVLCGARVADQGLLSGNAHEVLRLRRQWEATGICIFADVQVKHSAPLATRPLTEELMEALDRGGADAVIITGTATGQATHLSDLQVACDAASRELVWVGSGVTPSQIPQIAPVAGGFIVGSYCKQGGKVTNPVDRGRVRELVDALRIV